MRTRTSLPNPGLLTPTSHAVTYFFTLIVLTLFLLQHVCQPAPSLNIGCRRAKSVIDAHNASTVSDPTNAKPVFFQENAGSTFEECCVYMKSEARVKAPGEQG